MAKKKRTSIPLNDGGIDWNSPVGAPEPLNPAPVAEPAPAAEQPGLMRRLVGDTAASVARGTVQGVRMLTDLGGADNAVSTGLRSVEDYIGSLQSATAKADQQEIARILGEAEGKGILDQVVAGAKAFGVAPLQTTAQALGTSVPTLATALIPGVGAGAVMARTAAGLGLGAAQGVGGVKSSIYDDVKQAALKAGAAPDEAERRAAWAQSYNGPNAAQIALGAGLGAWAGRSGIEGALDRLVHGSSKAAPGMLARVGLGAVAEGIPEAAQGGQEKYATNTALTNAGFPTDPMSGVVANATMEGLAGHAMGGLAGIPKPGDQLRKDKLPEAGPMTRALNAAVEAAAQKADAGAPVPTDPTAPAPTSNAAAQAGVTAMLDEERRKVEQAAAEQALFDRTYPGAATAAQAAPDATAAARAQREADRPPEPTGEPQEGDILNAKGKPFLSMDTAMRRLAQAGGEATHELVRVRGGLVVRPKAGAAAAPAPAEEAAAPAAAAPETAAAPEGSQEDDPLLAQAIDIVRQTGRGSASLVQRHLRIGYNRVQRLLEAMERAGIVGPMKTDGQRDVLAPASQTTTKETPDAVDADGTAGQRPDDARGGDGTGGVPDRGPADVLDGAASPAGQGMAGTGAAGDAAQRPGALTPGSTFTLDDKTWTLKDRTDKVLTVDDGEGQTKKVPTSGKLGQRIIAALGGPGTAAPAPAAEAKGATDGERQEGRQGLQVAPLQGAGETPASGARELRAGPTDIDPNKEAVREHLEAGKAIKRLTIREDGNGLYVGTSIDANTHFQITLTAGERKARQRALADLELADTADERNAAQAAEEDALRPAIERAIRQPSAATNAQPTPAPAQQQAIDAVEPAPKTVTVNGERVALTPEQAAEWDKTEAEFKAKFDSAKQDFERATKNGKPDDPDVGYRNPQEQYDATRKALGMQLSAERRRIAGKQTPKERAAADQLAARVRKGDIVQTPEGTGEVTGMAFGKVRVQIGDRTVTVAHADAKKVAQPTARPTKNAESAAANPVAESASPRDRDSGDGAVARTLDGSGTAPTKNAEAPVQAASGESPAAPAAPAPASATTPAQGAAPSANTVFTEDAAAAARARLKAKLGRLNSGLDPEMMMDGITLAGYHIEKGARTFAAYARAMVDDLGDGVKPYLKSFYNALRDYPGFDASGMTAYESVAGASLDVVLRESIDSSLGEPASNRVAMVAGLFADLPQRQTLLEQGFDGLDVADQRSVLAQVRAGIQDGKVFRAVVESVPVDVMDMLAGEQLTAKQLLSDPTMFKERLSVAPNGPIPPAVARIINELASSLHGKGTFAGAESSAARANFGRATPNAGGASETSDSRHGDNGTEVGADRRDMAGPTGPDAPARTDTSLTADEARAALESGERILHLPGTEFEEEHWVERTDRGWVMRQKTRGSMFTDTKGGAGAAGGWSRDEAVRRVLSMLDTRKTDSVTPAAAPEAQNDAKENPSDERAVQSEGAEALDGMAAAEGGGPEGGGRTGRSAADGRKLDQGASGRADGAGLSTPRGGRSGATGVRASQAGTEGAGNAGTAGRTRRKGKGAPQVDAVDDLPAAPEPAVPAAPQIPAANFRITPDLKLGEGGEAEKFRDNLAAIRVLKTIESENRRATADEQRMLARYVGWGGIPNAFPNPQTKQFKPEWKARGEELQGLLSPPEYRRASNSTTDAHFTSETVTTAVWEAVKRLGFKGGLSLEMSLGSGNFIGLMPEDVAGRTRFIGVELDSITARIARALYPQSSVLESGMQYVPLAANAFDLDIGNPPFGDTSLTWQYNPGLRGLSIHNQFFVAGLNALKPGGIQAKVVSRYLLDAQDSTARKMLAVKGKLLGAIRLPETAFKTNARTQVVTDIVFLQRREKFEEDDVQQALWWLEKPLERAQLAKMDEAGRARYERLTEKYRHELQWVVTGKVNDPLGGEPMTVNRYFVQNPGMVVGTMDRSGSMQHGADVTVKLAPGADFAAELAQRIQKLPEGVLNRSDEAINAAIERHKSMADALEIAVSGQEPGQMVVDRDGKLMQVFERETPEGDYELGKRELTAASPWSPQLFMDGNGQWYREVVKLGADGKPLKLPKKDGTPGTRNVTEREVFGGDDKVPDTLRLGETRLDRLRDIAALRDLLKRQLVLEAQDDSKDKMEANRTALAAAYDAYVAKHGFVSESLTGALVNDMPDGALVQALELSFKPAISKEKAAKTGDQPRAASVKRAPIMSRRVVVPYSPPGRAETATDAMQISLAERGIIDVDRIAALRGITPDEAAAELTEGERPLAFRDPETGNIETRDAYLTGEVARKLRAARDAGLTRNVEALDAVQPPPITSDNVTVILGTSWVPSEVYADFVTHITGEPARVKYEPLTNTRMVVGKNTVKAQEWAARNEAGRVTVEAITLLQDAMNSQATKVYYTDADGVPHLNKEDTELAAVKRKEIEREFAEWVFADSDRRRLLVQKFNEKFNTRVTRQHDGSHLILPGKVPDEVISLRRHQKNAVWRGISERFMLLDHVVGAGKTYTAIARVMERRRMGLSRKPMIVVPNHMVEQFAADVYRLYPGAKVLAAGKKDFDKRARRRLFGKIATGDWDVVVVPHSSFQFIGLSPETEDAFLQEELRQALKALKDAEADQEPGTRFKSIGVKKAEALVKKIEARIDAVKGANKDRLLTFEQMGVDDMTVDEAHEFKNLFYSTRMDNVRGMGDSSGSGKAFDLYTKVRYLRSTPTGSVVFMTGTPISNSAVEMFTMMRYLAADELRDLGLEHFDAWRTQFVDASTAYEQQLTGGVKEVARLGRTWGNARSLMDLYYSFTDAVTIEDIKAAYAEDNPGKAFPVPRIKGGERQQVVVKPSPALVAMLTEIFDRYDALPDIEDVQERNAERLRLMDMARKASLDLRAVDPKTPSKEEGGKLDRVADEVARIHKQWTPDRGTQLVFLDRSVPKSKTDAAELKAYDKAVAARDKALADGKEDAYRDAVEELEKFDSNAMAEMRAAQAGAWNAYQQIKDNLIARGVPANEIRFIQEANNDEQKQAMFDAVNAGEIRVLIGSTPRMGAGTNVQERLVGLHHVDVGWKPSDIEQREGRIVRQGNSLLDKYGDKFEVEVITYATERTADASLWALNGMKLKTINGIRKYDGSFTMEFEDEDSLSMAQMAALASGDPLLLERIQLVGEIDKLERIENSHRRKLMGLRDRIEEAEQNIKSLPVRIQANEERAAEVSAWEGRIKQAAASRGAVVEGKTYHGDSAHYDAARAALAAAKEQQGDDEKAKFAITINGKRITSKTGIENALMESFGDGAPFEATIYGEKQVTRSGAVRQIVEKARELAINLEQGQSEGFDIGDVMGMKLVGDVSRSSWGKNYDITFSLLDKNGKTIASEQSRDGSANHDYSTQFVRAPFDRLFSGMVGDSYASSARYYRDQLARTKAELPELQRQLETAGPFKQADELEQKRDRLEEVTRLLMGAGKDLQHIDDFGMLFKADPQSTGQDDFGDQIALDGGTAYSRTAGSNRGVPMPDAKAVVATIRTALPTAPPLHLLESISQAPRALRDRIKAEGAQDLEAAYHAGEIYVFTRNIDSIERMQFVVAHHEIRHHGIRSRLGTGDELGAAMHAMWAGNQSLRKAAQAKMDAGLAGTRALAVEEALADMPVEEIAKLKGWQRLIAAARQWLRQVAARLRKAGLTAVADAVEPKTWTDADVARFVLRAEDVSRGGTAVFRAGGTVFQRDKTLPASTDTRRYQNLKWEQASDDMQIAELGNDWQATIVQNEDGTAELSILYPGGVDFGEPITYAHVGEARLAAPGILARSVWDDGTQPGDPMDHLMSEGQKNGTAFSRPADADTMRSAEASRSVAERFNDLTKTLASFNWWHKTIGTQFHKAKTNPLFRRVYDKAQEYLHDTSAFANDPADLAGDLLPQLRTLGDMRKKLALSQADGDNLARAVFGGTLAYTRNDSGQVVEAGPDDTAGVVFTPAELRDLFKFTDHQVKLYQQFRAATDRSLDILVAADVARLLGDGLPAPLKAMISAGDTGRFKGLVTAWTAQQRAAAEKELADVRRRHRNEMAGLNRRQNAALEGAGGRAGTRMAVAERFDKERADLKFKQGGEKYRAEQQVKKWADLDDTIQGKFARIGELKAQGYAPLMRFGRYTVDVIGQDGARQFFGMFETEREANAAARKFREAARAEGEDTEVKQGILSEEAYRQFSGLTPETVELFAEVAGLEKNEAFQAYLRLAKNNRSAMKRLIKRTGVAGFSEDTPRVLAAFLTSNARAASSALHLGELAAAVEDIPKEHGDVKDQAIKLREYVQNPQEEAQAIRSLLFVQYLGGSVASAIVNMTQPLMMTFPYLSQFGGPAKAAARLASAVRQAVTGVDPKTELGRALKLAEKEGITAPQELHQLQAEAWRTLGNHPAVRRILFAWGGFFSLAEQFNRKVSFIAAFNTAKEQKIDGAFGFAANSVDETQGVYNKANRPNWARGAVGATVFTFKQYSISYMEFLTRLPRRERTLALAILVLAAGAQGLPGADDLDDLIDTLGQHLGYDTNAKLWKARVLNDAIGADAADFALHGFSALPGFPLDVAGRLGLGNLIPGTGLLLKSKADKSSEVAEAIGPLGSTVMNTVKAIPSLLSGDLWKVNQVAGPTALKNLGKAIEMYQTGEYRDMAGRKVVDVTPGDALVKAIGFQPAEVARDSRKVQMANQQVGLARNIEAEIASQWAAGIVDKEPEKVAKARERLREWNRANPESRIAITQQQIQRRVKEMRKPRDERFTKSAPKEMRGTVAEVMK